MKAFGLLVLLVGSAVSAPQGAKEAKEVKEVKEARQLFSQDSYFHQGIPQFGARLSVIPTGQAAYYPGSYQSQYIPGQQLSYYSGAPAQAYYSGVPSQSYYGGFSQYYQPQANLVAAKKTVKPVVYQAAAPQLAYHTPAVTTFKAAAPAFNYAAAPAPAFKASVPSFSYAAAPAPLVKAAAAPAPALLKAAAPHPAQYSAEPNHVIVKQAQDDNFDGSFNYGYETDHGIAVETSGFVKNAGSENEIQVIQGSYTYYSPEGVPIVTTYIADENGFQVQGDHLPVAPPLPEAIAKSIEYQRSLPPSAEEHAQPIIPASQSVIASRPSVIAARY